MKKIATLVTLLAASLSAQAAALPQSSDTTHLYAQATHNCVVKDEIGQHDCYEEALKGYRGHPSDLTTIDLRDAVAYCSYVAESNDASYCDDLRSKHQNLFDAEFQENHARATRLRQREAKAAAMKPKVVQVEATGVSVAPGAVICPDMDRVQMVFDLYAAHYRDVMQDRLTNGQTRLLHGAPGDAPEPSDYGCALVATGTLMTLERGNIVPIVTATMPNGATVRGVTMPAMIKGCYLQRCW